jgi:EmrB/QacA subfamily drug resistance transporter
MASSRTGSKARLIALIVACALFMQNLDSTVIATALPTMARAFGSDPVRMNVALTSYLLTLTMFIPASGWVADRFGTRRVFRAAIAVFTVGSVLCGSAHGLGFLVAARVVQGIGGAMMVPVGRLVLLRSIAKTELVGAMAWLTIPALVGPVVGPPVGGLIVTYASWPWIFYINVPIGVLGIVLVSLFVEDIREAEPGRFDVWGLLLSSAALLGLLAGLESLTRGLLPEWLGVLITAGGVAGALGYVRHARGADNPVLRLSLLRYPTFAVSVGAGTLFRIGIGAIPFLLPVMLQLGFGVSAARSGAITFASSAGALVMKPVVRTVLRWVGFRTTLIWNGVLSAAGLAVFAAFRPDWPLAAIYAVLLAGGFLRSLQFTSYNTLAYAEVSRSEMSAATSFYSTAQQLSQTLGVAAGAGLLQAAMAWRGHATPELGDFSFAFLAVAAVSLLAAPTAARLPRDAGAEMAGRAVAVSRRPG